MDTRTILVPADAFDGDDRVDEQTIEKFVTEAAERFYESRDDVRKFLVTVRHPDYMNVQLPDDYYREESEQIIGAAWDNYCNQPA